jgi:hypothetical protein
MSPGGDKLGETSADKAKMAQALLPVQIESQASADNENERSEARREPGGRSLRKIPRVSHSENYPLAVDAEAWRTRGVRQIKKSIGSFEKRTREV